MRFLRWDQRGWWFSQGSIFNVVSILYQLCPKLSNFNLFSPLHVTCCEKWWHTILPRIKGFGMGHSKIWVGQVNFGLTLSQCPYVPTIYALDILTKPKMVKKTNRHKKFLTTHETHPPQQAHLFFFWGKVG